MSKLCSTTTLTIPKEILEISKLNLKKPIYLCHDTSFYLSNSKKHCACYGQIVLDENYTFELPEMAIITLTPDKSDIPLLNVWVKNGIIKFNAALDRFQNRHYPSSLKINVPSILIRDCKMNPNKAIYLYTDYYGAHYLSHRKLFDSSDICLGRVSMDECNCITLTRNMCISAGFSFSKNIELLAADNIIFLRGMENGQIKISNFSHS